MKETFYFSHDYNARNDDKILEIRDKYKNEGYAVFFYCLETMAERGDGYIIPTLIGGLSLGYGVAKEWLLEFLEFCVKIGIFKKDDVGYSSSRMICHIKFRAKLSKAGSDGATKRWRGYSPPNAKERKGKEIKINNTVATATEEKFNFPIIKEKMFLDANKRMPIIAHYWNYQKIEFTNRAQYNAGIKRELRPAGNLIGYPIERIKEVMYWLNGEDWIAESWTLETVHKYIDRDLNLINEKKYEKPKRTFDQTPKEY